MPTYLGPDEEEYPMVELEPTPDIIEVPEEEEVPA